MKKLDEGSLLQLLKVCVELINVKELRPILVSVAKCMAAFPATIPSSYLKLFVQSGFITVRAISHPQCIMHSLSYISQEFPPAVKQQAWRVERAFYISAIDAVLLENPLPTDRAKLEETLARSAVYPTACASSIADHCFVVVILP